MVAPGKRSAVDRFDEKIHADKRTVKGPDVKTFQEFLEKCARVPVAKGEYGPYTFTGREALIEVVKTIDLIIGSETGKPLKDAKLSLAGGAQFGKSILELNFAAWYTGVRFGRWGFYLPDGDLVEGMIDTKFRPDILDQQEWFADMTKVGRAVNKSGKSVNRKGAFQVTDGVRNGQGMIIGLNKKVPTSFTFDVTTLDEVDDIDPRKKKFVRGRMTSSDQRFMMEVGTQRVAGRGMNKSWKDGSQGVLINGCSCGTSLNLEETFPHCIRVAMDGTPRRSDPILQRTADFRRDLNGEVLAVHSPEHHYYTACPKCGEQLGRGVGEVEWNHRRPEQVALRNWSFRISQLSIAAIDLSQIVAHWGRAVADPEDMVSFLCDVLGLPESTDQKISPAILDRARGVEVYDLGMQATGARSFGGVDTGRRCFFFARDVQSAEAKRLRHLEQIAVGNLVSRTVDLYSLYGLECLCIDIAPETDAARTIALKLNGLESVEKWPVVPEGEGHISFPGGLRWNGNRKRWEGCHCFVVEFTKRNIGAGISHGFDQFEKGGHQMFVPKISCNRFESIDRAVREFLTPGENVSEVIQVAGGKNRIRMQPAMRLPRQGAGSPKVLETLDNHLLVGSERAEAANGEPGDYVDKVENHFLLADAYSALAEIEGGGNKAAPVQTARIGRSDESGRDRRTAKFAGI